MSIWTVFNHYTQTRSCFTSPFFSWWPEPHDCLVLVKARKTKGYYIYTFIYPKFKQQMDSPVHQHQSHSVVWETVSVHLQKKKVYTTLLLWKWVVVYHNLLILLEFTMVCGMQKQHIDGKEQGFDLEASVVITYYRFMIIIKTREKGLRHQVCCMQ